MATWTPTKKPYSKPQPQQQKPKEYFAPTTLADVTIIGYVRTEIEAKETKTGLVVTEFLTSFGQTPDKEGNKSGSISVKAFGNVATHVAGNITKGSKVAIKGRLTEEVWADKESGARRNKHVITADCVILLTSERESEEYQDE